MANILWQTIDNFGEIMAFTKKSTPADRHLNDDDAYDLLMAQDLPNGIRDLLIRDTDVMVFGLSASDQHGPFLLVGLPND